MHELCFIEKEIHEPSSALSFLFIIITIFYLLAVFINVPNAIMTVLRIYVHAYVTYWNASKRWNILCFCHRSSPNFDTTSDDISWRMKDPISKMIYLYHETRLRYTIPFRILNSVIRAVCKRLRFCTRILAQLTGSSRIVCDSPRSCKGRSVFSPRNSVHTSWVESSWTEHLIGQTWVDLTELDSVMRQQCKVIYLVHRTDPLAGSFLRI
jgi:hypothetical protein